MRNETGMPVIPYVKKQGLFEAKVLAAHCVHIDEGEMRTLLHARAGAAQQPSSNLKLASGFAPVSKMLETGPNVGNRHRWPGLQQPTWICVDSAPGRAAGKDRFQRPHPPRRSAGAGDGNPHRGAGHGTSAHLTGSARAGKRVT